jgi:hypothetical protein
VQDTYGFFLLKHKVGCWDFPGGFFGFHRKLEFEGCQVSLALLHPYFSAELLTDSFATCKSHSNVTVLDFAELLLHFEFQKWFEQHLLSFFTYSETGVNYFGFKQLLITRGLAVENNDDVTHKAVVLNTVLDNVEQNQLVGIPVCCQLQLGEVVLSAEEHLHLPVHHKQCKRIQNLLDECLRVERRRLIWSELILLYLHSLDLVLVVKVHLDSGLLNNAKKGERDFVYVYLLLELLFNLVVLHELVQLNKPLLAQFAVSNDAVQRRHLFVTVVCFDGVLVHFINDFLLALQRCRLVS